MLGRIARQRRLLSIRGPQITCFDDGLLCCSPEISRQAMTQYMHVHVARKITPAAELVAIDHTPLLLASTMSIIEPNCRTGVSPVVRQTLGIHEDTVAPSSPLILANKPLRIRSCRAPLVIDVEVNLSWMQYHDICVPHHIGAGFQPMTVLWDAVLASDWAVVGATPVGCCHTTPRSWRESGPEFCTGVVSWSSSATIADSNAR